MVPAIVRDVGTRHVACHQDGVCIMGADRGVEHSATAPWTKNGEVPWPANGNQVRAQQQKEEQET
jgi:hypothetical protein